MQTTFSSINVRGLRNKQTRDHIFQWLKTNNYSICLFQETHSNQDSVDLWEREWGRGHAYFSGDKSNKEGIGILINEKLNVQDIKHKEIIVGRIQSIEIKIENKNVIIVNVYGPNTDDAHFFEILYNFIRANDDKNIIIGGDFNTTLNPNIDKKNGNTDAHKKCRLQLNNLIDSFDLCDIWRSFNLNKKQYNGTPVVNLSYLVG